MRRSIYILPFLALTLLMGSCKIGKQYKQPELNLPDQVPGNQSPMDTATVSDIKWWELYSDSTLQTLIVEALDNNKDLLIASKRIEEFAASKKMAFADLFPTIGIAVEGEREHDNYGGNKPVYDNTLEGKFTFGWEVDVWGKLRWANDKAKANFLQSIEFQRGVRMGIISEVTQRYFEISAAHQELSIVKRTIVARREGVRLARLRFESGLTSETSLRQSEVELARTETLQPALEKQIGVLENELSLLLGKYPKEYTFGAFRASDVTTIELPVGLPSQLLQRRPDIRGAEQSLKAANAAVGIAFTSMFPSIKLTGSGGVESGDLSSFLKSPYWAIGGGLFGPIFNMGKNRANWKKSEVQYEQEMLSYQKTVLTAFKEVNNALLAYNKNKEIVEKRRRLSAAAKSYLELANLQYINGIISYIDVLDAQRGMLDAEIGLSNALRDSNLALVYLYKSLGGGWN